VWQRAQHLLTASLGGIAGTAVDLGVLVLLVEHGAPVPVAAFAGAASGAGVCFAANKYWAFRDRSPLSVRQVGSFGLVALTTAVIMAIAMQVAAVWLGLPYLVAKALCAAAVFCLWSYPAQRRFVFPATAAEADLDVGLDLDPSHSLA